VIWNSVTQRDLNRKIDMQLSGGVKPKSHLRMVINTIGWPVWANIFVWVYISFAWTDGWRQVLMGLIIALWWGWVGFIVAIRIVNRMMKNIGDHRSE